MPYAIGSPGGVQFANTITGGQASAINRDLTVNDRVMTLIQTDAHQQRQLRRRTDQQVRSGSRHHIR